MKLTEIITLLDAEVLAGSDHLDIEITACGAADLMEDLSRKRTKGSLLITGLTSNLVIQTSIENQIGTVLMVRGKKPHPNMLKLAEASQLPVVLTQHAMFTASGMLYMAGLRGLDGSW